MGGEPARSSPGEAPAYAVAAPLRLGPRSCTACVLLIAQSGSPVLFANRILAVAPERNSLCFGHLAVLPRRHVRELVSLTDEEYVELQRVSRQLAAWLRQALRPARLAVLRGREQETHARLHVLPLALGDETADPQRYTRSLSEAQLRQEAAALRRLSPPLDAFVGKEQRLRLLQPD